MRILADENIPASAVTALRAAGHDVVWVRTDMPGARDSDVIARAIADSRVLLTFDKDFGELAFRKGLAPPCGIILLRLATRPPASVASSILTLVQSRSDWEGHFCVVDDHSVRIRPLA